MENFSDEPPVKTDTATGDAAAKFKLKPGRSVGNVAAIAAALTAGISPIHRRHRGRYIGPGRTAKQDSRFNDQCKRYHAAQRKLAFWTRVTVAEAHKRGLARVRKYFAKMDNALEAFYSPRTDGDPLSLIISPQA